MPSRNSSSRMVTLKSRRRLSALGAIRTTSIEKQAIGESTGAFNVGTTGKSGASRQPSLNVWYSDTPCLAFNKVVKDKGP